MKSAALCMAASLLAHGAIGAAAMRALHRADAAAPIVAELDFTLAPASPFSKPGGGGKPSEQWLLPPQGKKAPPPPPPSARPEPVASVEEVKASDERACFGDNCTGEGKGSGPAVGDGDGGVIDAADASSKPRWVRNFITSADYPRLARQRGKDGLVVLRVILDERGRVRRADLVQGAYEPLNEAALRKIQDAVFTPARDKSGRTVACRLLLPIRFQMR